MHGIFDDNKDRLWFAEQYHPDNYDSHQAKLKAAAASRLEVFNMLLTEGRLDKITWKPDSRKRLELVPLPSPPHPSPVRARDTLSHIPGVRGAGIVRCAG